MCTELCKGYSSGHMDVKLIDILRLWLNWSLPRRASDTPEQPGIDRCVINVGGNVRSVFVKYVVTRH